MSSPRGGSGLLSRDSGGRGSGQLGLGDGPDTAIPQGIRFGEKLVSKGIIEGLAGRLGGAEHAVLH